MLPRQGEEMKIVAKMS